MRPKRLIALTLLMLANIFLLAHVVLPHSHHDGVVCFSLEEMVHQHHCSHNHVDACDCNCHHAENHHHHGDSEDCNLKEIVIRQDNNSHHEILPCATCLSLLYTIYSLNDLYLVVPEYGHRLVQKPYLITYIPPYVGTISGLRAPPASYFLG